MFALVVVSASYDIPVGPVCVCVCVSGVCGWCVCVGCVWVGVFNIKKVQDLKLLI